MHPHLNTVQARALVQVIGSIHLGLIIEADHDSREDISRQAGCLARTS